MEGQKDKWVGEESGPAERADVNEHLIQSVERIECGSHALPYGESLAPLR